MPWSPPPPATIVGSPTPLETTAMGFCRGLAAQPPLELRMDPARLGILRKQTEALLSACEKALPGDGRVLPLLGAALGVLETATGLEPGERRFALAALTLARRWRSAQVTCHADPARCLLDTPLGGSVRDFLQRMDQVLAEDLPPCPALRRRIARDRGDVPAQTALLRGELEEARDPETILRLLKEAGPLLQSRMDEGLLETGTRKLKAALRTPVPPPQVQALEAWARLQIQAGHGPEAEDLLRPLFAEGEMSLGAYFARPKAGASQATDGGEDAGSPPAQLLEIRKATLAAQCRDAEARLGPDHPKVAEILVEWGTLEEDGIAHLERAVDILKKAPPGREEALLQAYMALAGCCALDPQGLDRCQMAMLQCLEGLSSLEGEVAKGAKEFPLILGIRLWREQRIDDILALFPRLLALLNRYPVSGGSSEGFDEGKEGDLLLLLERTARLQGRIRAAGLR